MPRMLRIQHNARDLRVTPRWSHGVWPVVIIATMFQTFYFCQLTVKMIKSLAHPIIAIYILLSNARTVRVVHSNEKVRNSHHDTS